MKHSMLKPWVFFLMFVLVFSLSAYKSDYVHADRDEHEYQADYREYKGKQRESEHQEYHEAEKQHEDEEYEDEEYEDEEYEDEEYEYANKNEQSGVNKVDEQHQAVDAQNQNPAVNQEVPLTVKPVPAADKAESPAANRSPIQFVDGQTVQLTISGLDKPLTLTLRVHNGELRVAAEKVLRPMNIPYLTYRDGTLLELYSGRHHLIFRDGKKAFYDNGQKHFISMAPQSANGYFYLPLILLADRLGYALEWSPQSQTFLMKKEG